MEAFLLFLLFVVLAWALVRISNHSDQLEKLRRQSDGFRSEIDKLRSALLDQSTRPAKTETPPAAFKASSRPATQSPIIPSPVIEPEEPEPIVTPPELPTELGGLPVIIESEVASPAATEETPPLVYSVTPAPKDLALHEIAQPVVEDFAASQPPPPPPRAPSTPPPLPPSGPSWMDWSIDWEQFMGAKLFAWLGGLALFLGVAFFVKYSFEHNLIPPAVRAALGFLIGSGLIVGGLKIPRARYAITAQTLIATGIVSLYAVTFACNSIYHFAFFGAVPTFLLMSLITATAFILAVRLDAQVVAILGILGGFLTPKLLSTGVDNPMGLFGYARRWVPAAWPRCSSFFRYGRASRRSTLTSRWQSRLRWSGCWPNLSGGKLLMRRCRSRMSWRSRSRLTAT